MNNSKTATQKHMTLDDRISIEKGLDQHLSLRSIALQLGKDPTTISKEIKKHRSFQEHNRFNEPANKCALAKDCKKKNICGTLDGDSGKLMQIFYNLTDNAIKYTPENGHIAVRLAQSGANVLFAVTDDGIGIPEEDQKHIFERFYRVDKARSRATGGTGLGLSIVRQLAAMHGGTVSVSSKPGQGATFTVTLPMDAKRGEKA